MQAISNAESNVLIIVSIFGLFGWYSNKSAKILKQQIKR
ncbi:MAG: hypothetical protein TRG1_2109 [Flavobacteriaceae bacterium FS1-H7996/R]|nr:MAG: hypothetical protein TRG1_2109 [Flavobacteriaceae bacterium FS1-H7996/R]